LSDKISLPFAIYVGGESGGENVHWSVEKFRVDSKKLAGKGRCAVVHKPYSCAKLTNWRCSMSDRAIFFPRQ
jgi:hypothetical protein